jgi:aspartyl-tRNA(Asn)/glutamyl-tRNA(Gln) amidotransferase subunit A
VARTRSALDERRHTRHVEEVIGADRLGAFVHVAPQPGGEGELAGVTIAVKDNIDVAGMPAAAGMEPYRDRIAQRDATCVARLRTAGAAFPGKTLMDEAALGALGDNPWFGRCHNPARMGFTPGGSSAGSAAAVAASLCDAALGTDTLGSVRIPASYCGVVGYVPGRGSVDAAGVMPLMPEFDRVGVLARSVAGAARVASVMAARPIEIRANATLGVLRGVESFVAGPVCAALDRAARRHRATDVRSNIDWGALRRAALLLVEREGARVHAGLLADPDSRLSPALRASLEFGRDASAERVARARDRVDEAKRWLSEVLRGCDVLLLPATPQTAFTFDGPVPDTQADLAVPASVAGFAAVSIPAGECDGLPFGLQAVGRDDGLVLGVAAALA